MHLVESRILFFSGSSPDGELVLSHMPGYTLRTAYIPLLNTSYTIEMYNELQNRNVARESEY
jgi:hypothetical protein